MVDEQEYLALSSLLGAPAEDSLPALAEQGLAYPWLEEALPELQAMPLEQWQAEHTRLFLCGHPTTPCAPFASVWRSGDMFGPAHDAARRFISQLGMHPGEAPADYLGVLLECAALLSARATSMHTDLKGELWRDHLLPWLPKLAEAMREHSTLRLYHNMGRRLQELCDEHR